MAPRAIQWLPDWPPSRPKWRLSADQCQLNVLQEMNHPRGRMMSVWARARVAKSRILARSDIQFRSNASIPTQLDRRLHTRHTSLTRSFLRVIEAPSSLLRPSRACGLSFLIPAGDILPTMINSDQSPSLVVDGVSLHRTIASVGSKFEMPEVFTFDTSERPCVPGWPDQVRASGAVVCEGWWRDKQLVSSQQWKIYNRMRHVFCAKGQPRLLSTDQKARGIYFQQSPTCGIAPQEIFWSTRTPREMQHSRGPTSGLVPIATRTGSDE
ncbi:hypothetical protein EDB86DRAFT_44045 [Lactarius hatsudake]|nr:hypothetical protein EDB86DRAFT_44045 [Lactarius hatsudake]